jgi:hypothetical protein
MKPPHRSVRLAKVRATMIVAATFVFPGSACALACRSMRSDWNVWPIEAITCTDRRSELIGEDRIQWLEFRLGLAEGRVTSPIEFGVHES